MLEVGDDSRIRFWHGVWLWCSSDKALQVVYAAVFRIAHCEETLAVEY